MAFFMIETAQTVTQNVMSSMYSNWKYMVVAAIVLTILVFLMIYNAFVFGQRVEDPQVVVVKVANFQEKPPVDEPTDVGNGVQQQIDQQPIVDQSNEGGEGRNEHTGKNNIDNNIEVNDTGTIVYNDLGNNGATNIRGSEEGGSEIGQKEKAKNIIDPITQVDNPENVNVSPPDNATDPALPDFNEIEDEEYIQKPQEQDETILLVHIAPFPHTATCSTITNSTRSSESDDDDIEVLQNPVKKKIKSEEAFDLNSPTKRTIGLEMTDQPEEEVIHVPEDDIVKKDQATPLEKENPEILASILTRQEEHEYMTTAIEVEEANIVKPSWVVQGFMYHKKDLSSDLSEPDSFDINLSSGVGAQLTVNNKMAGNDTTEQSERNSDGTDLTHLGLSLNLSVDITDPSTDTGSHTRHLLSIRNEYTTQDTGSRSSSRSKYSGFTAQVKKKPSENGLERTETEGSRTERVASNVEFEASVTSYDVAASFTPPNPKLDVPLSEYSQNVVYTPQSPP